MSIYQQCTVENYCDSCGERCRLLSVPDGHHNFDNAIKELVAAGWTVECPDWEEPQLTCPKCQAKKDQEDNA